RKPVLADDPRLQLPPMEKRPENLVSIGNGNVGSILSIENAQCKPSRYPTDASGTDHKTTNAAESDIRFAVTEGRPVGSFGNKLTGFGREIVFSGNIRREADVHHGRVAWELGKASSQLDHRQAGQVDHSEPRTNVRQVIEEILSPSTWLNAASRENNSFQTRNERIGRRDNILQLVTERESGDVGWKTQLRGAALLDTGKDHGCAGPKLIAQPQRKRQIPRGVGYDDADSFIAILFTEVRTHDIGIVCRIIRINSQILDKDKWRVRGFCLDGGVKSLAHLAKPRIYRSILIEE